MEAKARETRNQNAMSGKDVPFTRLKDLAFKGRQKAVSGAWVGGEGALLRTIHKRYLRATLVVLLRCTWRPAKHFTALYHFFIMEEIQMISHERHKILHVICKMRKLRFRGRKLPQITKLRHDTARIQSQPVDVNVHAFSFMPHHILLSQSACPPIFIQFLLKFSSFPPKHILHDLF